MRADQDALAALDAQVLVPNGNFECDVALLPLRGAGGEGAVERHGAHRQIVAFAGYNARRELLHEIGRAGRNRRPHIETGGGFDRYLHFAQVAQCGIHGGEILLHHGLAALAVSLLDGVLDRRDGLFARQYAADGEEAGLHDGVDAPAHAGLLGYLVAIDHEEAQLLGDDLALHRKRQLIPNFVRAERAVQQEGGARLGALQHVQPLQERKLVAGYEICVRDQVAGVQRLRSEAQMRNGDGAGLLRIVNEVALRVVVGFLADNLDGVLVRADRAVRAQAVEQRAHRAGHFARKRGVVFQAGVAYIVQDADGEMILRLRLRTSRRKCPSPWRA